MSTRGKITEITELKKRVVQRVIQWVREDRVQGVVPNLSNGWAIWQEVVRQEPSLASMPVYLIRASSGRAHHKSTYVIPRLFPINLIWLLVQGGTALALDASHKPMPDAFMTSLQVYVALINRAVSQRTNQGYPEGLIPVFTPAMLEASYSKEAKKEVDWIRFLLRYLPTLHFVAVRFRTGDGRSFKYNSVPLSGIPDPVPGGCGLLILGNPLGAGEPAWMDDVLPSEW